MDDIQTRRELTRIAYQAASMINVEGHVGERVELEIHFLAKFHELLELGKPSWADGLHSVKVMS